MLRLATWAAASVAIGIVVFFLLVWVGAIAYLLLALWAGIAARAAWADTSASSPRSRYLRAGVVGLTSVALAFAGAEAFVAAFALGP